MRVLYLEDQPLDAELVQEMLASEGFDFDFTRVETKPDFEEALYRGGYDLIFSDKSLPSFDGLTALAIAKETRPDIPFIFISGTLGEEIAIESLKNGATDYVLKQRLKRIIPVTKRALRDAVERREKRLAEQETQQHLKRLDSLRNIDLAINGNLDLRLTLNVLLDHVISQLGVDAADVLLLEPHTQMLTFAAGRGLRTREFEKAHLRIGESYAGRAALERRIINIPDLQEDQSVTLFQPIAAREGFVAYYGAPLIAKGQIKGILELFHRAPLNPDRSWHDFFEMLAGQAALAIDNAQMFDDLQRSNDQLSLAYETTIEGWSRALDLRDKETEGHTQRVTDMTLRLAQALKIPDPQLVHIRRGALLHDIGKMGVPDSILLKPGPLTEEEWVIMRNHPVYAYDLLSPISYLRPALEIPYSHHEKWDGSGYPKGTAGEQIPLAARIFAVVDVWDALRNDRPYRKAWTEEKTREYIREQSGIHFDPKIVEVFLSML